MPYARKSDPQTSHDAARSVGNITQTQSYILRALKRPRSDEQLLEAYRAMKHAPKASDSGIRSRRAELARMGLIKEVGLARTEAGRQTRIWKVNA